MKLPVKKTALPLLFLLLSLGAFAQTTTTYTTTSGSISSANAFTANLAPLGQGYYFSSPDAFGSGCYYGSCPAWPFSGYTLNYSLPDGTNASLTNFTGTSDFQSQSDLYTQGTASGTDSTGAAVSVTVYVQWVAKCRSGRGGGCTKYFTTGTLTVTK